MTGELTKAQMDALRWMQDYPSDSADWCKDGKRTRLGHKHWNTMKLSGARGSVIIPLADWQALQGLIEGAAFGSGKIYAPNAAGRSALGEKP